MSRLIATAARVLRIGGIKTPLIISAVFLVLITSFVVFLNRYWSNTLEPRLYRTAETQATILAESQANILKQALVESLSRAEPHILNEAVQQILLVEDPAIGQNIVEGLRLQVDYQTVDAENGSLDIEEGNIRCSNCFKASIPLFTQRGDLLGVTDFNLSDAYFRELSEEIKSKLMTESSLALVLMVVVWFTMLVMFYRLNAAKQVIEDSDRAKTRFMANVTHELRTPLNAILGYTQLYKEDRALMQTHRRGIETIDRSAEHLRLMINDILDFSRTDQDRMTLVPAETSFIHFLKVICDIADSQARLKGIEFHCDIAPTLPQTVSVDEKRLRQVLLNLISNAIKFTEAGSVTLHVSVVDVGRDDVTVRMSVRDTGIGISDSDLNRIFVPFVQVDNTITRAEGSGLGLTISQRILQLMGSKLSVFSEPEQGSEFLFYLKLPAPQGVHESTAELLGPREVASEESITPPAEQLEEMIELAQKHNILGLRRMVAEMEQQAELKAFAQDVEPFLKSYRFKPLIGYLSQRLGSLR